MSTTTEPAANAKRFGDTEHIEEHDDDHVTEVEEKVRTVTEYEKLLRAQAAKQRRRALDAERERDERIAAAAREKDEAIAQAARERDERIAAIEAEARGSVIRAKLEAAAIRAGMVDVDGLKLLDLSHVKLDASGALVVPDKFFEQAKEAKPFLFGDAQRSSSNPNPPPRQEPLAPKRATEWTDAEMRAAEQRIATGQRLLA